MRLHRILALTSIESSITHIIKYLIQNFRRVRTKFKLYPTKNEGTFRSFAQNPEDLHIKLSNHKKDHLERML